LASTEPVPVAASIRDLFQSEVHVAEAAPALADDALYPEEWAYIAGAVPKRRAEFTTARVLARQLLRGMGIPARSLVPAKDRAPIWPPGIVGSIAHTNDHCVVVLARAPDALALGVDVETVRALEPGAWDVVLTPRERAWLANQPADAREALAIVFFGAKEAYYKCQYPLTGTFLEFHDVELELDLTRRVFEVQAIKPGLPSSIERLGGRFALHRGRVTCGIELIGLSA
jgi:4'-phosphopantetheinyl transferase EntD